MGTHSPCGGTPPATRVVVVDDHRCFATALAERLDLEPRVVVVGIAATRHEATELVAREDVDVLLVDLDLGGHSGLDLFRELHASRPQLQALVVTASTHPAQLLEAVRSGAIGWVDKARPLSELLEAIHRASAGEASFPAAMLARALDDPSLDTPSSAGRPGSLSQRELEILAALADGKSRQRIAAECHISVHTVRTHVQHILGKLHAPTTLAAVRLAREAGLLELTHTGVSTK